MGPQIELDRLQKVIDGRLVVDIDGLSVAGGEIAALVGPAGSGKAALLDLLTGRSRPTVGTVRLAGVDPYAERQAFSQRVGVLFSSDTLYQHRSPQANLVFYCCLYNLPPSRAGQVLAQVGLADHAEARLDRLPSGLARRLAFGRAILHRPSVLLLAEPFDRCDEASIALLGSQMRRLADDGAALLILSTDSAHLDPLVDVVHALEGGRLVDVVVAQETRRQALPFKIPVRLESKVVLVNPGDVLYAAAEEGRAFLQTAESRLPTQFTLSELEERLSRSGFFRAHRGFLVNLQHVKEVIPYTRNSYSLRLDDAAGTEIPLSKQAAADLRQLLDY